LIVRAAVPQVQPSGPGRRSAGPDRPR